MSFLSNYITALVFLLCRQAGDDHHRIHGEWIAGHFPEGRTEGDKDASEGKLEGRDCKGGEEAVAMAVWNLLHQRNWDRKKKILSCLCWSGSTARS